MLVFHQIKFTLKILHFSFIQNHTKMKFVTIAVVLAFACYFAIQEPVADAQGKKNTRNVSNPF